MFVFAVQNSKLIPLSKSPIILAIESSCDDTSAAVLKGKLVCSNLIANQAVHEQYGGVVPELASRAHQANIVPVVQTALKKANVELKDVEAIAFTKGPGLLGSLLVGTSFAKGLAWGLNAKLIEVNHMQAHILAHFISNEHNHYPNFPFICLTVSGGHTQLVLVKGPTAFEIIGQTIDDAIGEAFDKTAKLLNLPYPGGPLIDKMAKQGNPNAFKFPKPQVGEFEFSFSGIKTSVLYFLRDALKSEPDFIKLHLHDICASIQKTLVDIVIEKLEKAEKKYKTGHLAIAGGVSANSELRDRLQKLGSKLNAKTYIPPFEYCTDNAAMIGIAGYFLYEANQFANLSVAPKARLAL